MLRFLATLAICMVCGVLMLVFCGRQAVHAWVLLDRGRLTTGTVLDAQEKSRGGKYPSRYTELRVEFTAADGTRHFFLDSGDRSVGDTIDVHYDPQKPENATIGAPSRKYFLYMSGTAVFGLLLAVMTPIIGLIRLRYTGIIPRVPKARGGRRIDFP